MKEFASLFMEFCMYLLAYTKPGTFPSKPNDKVDPLKLNAFVFDQFQHRYYKIGEKIGQAWSSGAGLMK